MVDGRFSTRQPCGRWRRTRFEAEARLLLAGPQPTPTLEAGEVGYVVTGLKDVSRLRVGDTLTAQNAGRGAAPGYKDVKPTVFAGLFPTDSDEYPALRDASRSSSSTPPSSTSPRRPGARLRLPLRLPRLLHMEIVRRLEREFDLDLLVTAPNVAYRVLTKAGEESEVHNPADMPREVELVEEPHPRDDDRAQGLRRSVMELNNERRGRFTTWST